MTLRASLVRGTDQPPFCFAPAQYRKGGLGVIPADPCVTRVSCDEKGKAWVHLANGVRVRREDMAGVWKVQR